MRSISTPRSATGVAWCSIRVVSGVPLLNFPVARRIAYVEDLLDRIPPGRPIMQLTYGPLSPVPPGRGNYKVEHFDFVLRNIPPTQLWVYRRPVA